MASHIRRRLAVPTLAVAVSLFITASGSAAWLRADPQVTDDRSASAGERVAAARPAQPVELPGAPDAASSGIAVDDEVTARVPAEDDDGCGRFGIAPKAGPMGSLGDPVRVVTMNADAGLAKFRDDGSDGRAAERVAHVDRLAELVECLDADIVVLSEMQRHTLHWPDVDMVADLRATLGTGWRAVFERHCRIPQRPDPGGHASVGISILTTDTRDDEGYHAGFASLDVDGRRDRSMGVAIPTETPEKDRYEYPGQWRNRDNRCFWHADRATRWRGQQRSVAMASTHGFDVVGVHLTPGADHRDLRRKQLARIADRFETFRSRVDATLGSDPRPAIVAGDYNDDECLFAPCGDDASATFADFFGDGWFDAAAPIDQTHTGGGQLDHVVVTGAELAPAGDGSTSHQLEVDFLNHHVLYVDVAPLVGRPTHDVPEG